jgi:hypothetical protein
MYIRMNEVLNRVCALSFCDDGKYWADNGETGSYGKLLPVDLQDYDTQHIFFDDHIQLDAEETGSCVDCRDVVSGSHLPINKSAGRFLVKVDTFRVIVDFEYFVKELDAAE